MSARPDILIMILTDENKKAVVKWLAKHNASDFKCTVCGGEDFGILDDIVSLQAVGRPAAYSCVGIICSACRHIVLISSADILEVIP